MRKAFSALELLIIIAILCFCCLIFRNKTLNPITSVTKEHKELKTKQEIINTKLDNIQRIKNMQDEQLKQNLE